MVNAHVDVLRFNLDSVEYYTLERFLAIDSPTLYDARGFFYHAIGCNHKYIGNGLNEKGQAEYLIPNQPLSEIDGCIWIDLSVTQEDIDALKKLHSS